jgi:hypothetical protein
MAPCHRGAHKKSEVRAMFFNIPNIDAFINQRIARYFRKNERSNDATLPKKS